MRNTILLVVLLFLISVKAAHPEEDHLDYGLLLFLLFHYIFDIFFFFSLIRNHN